MRKPLLDRPAVTVGRDQELELLRRLLEDARAGRGGSAFLIGEAGAGKTRLLRDTAALATAERMSVLWGEAPHAVSPPPFGTAAAAFRSWTRAHDLPDEELRPFAAGLRHILPEWPRASTTPEPPPDQVRLLVLEAALRLMLAASRPYGAAVILDDLHEADPETVELVHHAAGSLAEAPTLVIAAMRPGGRGPAEPEARALEQRGRAVILEIAPLPVGDTETLIASILGGAPPAELVDEVMQRTDGVPLLVEELLAAYMAAGAITRDGNTIVWMPGTRSLVPPTIVQSVRRRLTALPGDARNVVGAASVLGAFDEPLLAAVSGVGEEHLVGAVELGVDAGLLDASLGALRFRHALVMDAVAEALVPMRRSELHRRAADALAVLHGDDADRFEERARHLEAAGRNGEAAAMLLAAAERSLAVQAPASAEAALRRALALSPDDQTSGALKETLVRSLTALGRWDEALRLDRDALDGSDDPERLTRMARNALRTGRLDEADAFIERAEHGGGRAGPLAALAGLIALWRGANERAVEIATRALEHGERTNDPTVVCDALDVMGRAKDALGRREEAIADFRRWTEVAQREEMHASHLQALMELGNVEYMGSGSPATLRLVRKRSQEAGALTTLVLADLSLTWCLGCNGALQEALDCAREATDYSRRFGLDLLPHALGGLAWIMGRLEPGSGEAVSAEALASAPNDTDVALLVHENRADSFLRTGRFEEAVEHYDRGWELMRSRRSQLPAMTAFVRISALVAAGRPDEARAALQEVSNWPARLQVTSNAFWLAAGEALVAGDADAFDDVITGSGDWPFERAIARTLAAEVLGGAHAPAWARDALAFFEGAGADADAARARALLRRLGAPVPRARRTRAAASEALREKGVTRREAEVLELVGKGMSNPEIAEKLYVSVRTVESHISSLLSKLGVDARPALIALALSMTERTG